MFHVKQLLRIGYMNGYSVGTDRVVRLAWRVLGGCSDAGRCVVMLGGCWAGHGDLLCSCGFLLGSCGFLLCSVV